MLRRALMRRFDLLRKVRDQFGDQVEFASPQVVEFAGLAQW